MGKSIPEKGTVILTVGLPYSGKTTWAEKQGHPIVSPDAIRLALHGQRYSTPAEPFVWAIASLMVDALFKAGHTTVIVDATNNTEARRKVWTDKYQFKTEIFPASTEECIARALRQSDEEIIPVIEQMNVNSDWR